MKNLRFPISGSVNADWHGVSHFLIRARQIGAFAEGHAAYRTYREHSFALRLSADEAFDRIAQNRSNWECERLNSDSAYLFGKELLSEISVSIHPGWVSLSVTVHATSPLAAERFRLQMERVLESGRIRDPMFSLVWTFIDNRGEFAKVEIDEIADEEGLDLAYPMLDEGVNAFIDLYLAAPETVLLLQGPPGTGKTRLIRQILGRASRASGSVTKAVYTTDEKAMSGDKLFVSFINGKEKFLIVEDADFILKSRNGGNEILHRFLAIADGVVNAQGRKIIFTTNLPSARDIDSALVRPGRCFAQKFIRALTLQEATRLLWDMGRIHGVAADALVAAVASSGQQSFALAEIYRRFRERDRPIDLRAEEPTRRFGFVG